MDEAIERGKGIGVRRAMMLGCPISEAMRLCGLYDVCRDKVE
jgi:hypothetical protein